MNCHASYSSLVVCKRDVELKHRILVTDFAGDGEVEGALDEGGSSNRASRRSALICSSGFADVS